MPRDAFAPVPGYYDLPGSRMLPGGSLAVSRSQGGQPRSTSGVDVPVVDYPGTGWYPGMPTGQEIPGVGLPLRGGEVGGGPVPGYSPRTTSSDYPGGSYGAYPAPDMNIPTNEDVLPAIQTLLYRNYLRGGSPGVGPAPNPTPGPSYPDLSNAPPVIAEGYTFPQTINQQYAPASSAYPMPGGWGRNMGSSFDPATGTNWAANARSTGAFGAYPDLSNASPVMVTSGFNAGGYPDLSGLPPVMVTPPGGYPIPGLGGTPAGDWVQNAQRSTSPSFAGAVASNFGFGGGLTSQGGGGWQSVSEIPSGAFGSTGPSNAFGGGGSRVFLS